MLEAVVEYVDSLNLADTQMYRNLAIVPLIGSDQPKDYLVLEEALSQGLVIAEQEQQNVPNLDISNETGTAVLIALGECFVGGGQNRQASANIYLEKGFKGKIPVQCIEHGRWNRAAGKKFSYGGTSPTSTRSATRHGQQEVWNSVSDTINLTRTRSGSDNLKDVYKQKEEKMREYFESFKQLDNQAGLVAIVGINGKKMLTADIFDTPKTMGQRFQNLVEAYIVDAIKYEMDKVEVNPEEVRNFLNLFKEATYSDRKDISLGTHHTVTGKGVEGNTLTEKTKTRYAHITTTW